MAHVAHSLIAQCRDAVARVLEIGTAADAPTDGQLSQIAATLGSLAASPAWQDAPYRAASAGEELVYELVITHDGVALYLVSDAPGTISPPHDHLTWAVVAGIRGGELNRLYRVSNSTRRLVRHDRDHLVGPGGVLSLGPQCVHSTVALATEPTFHLHMYGRPLHTLPSFASRCYDIDDAA